MLELLPTTEDIWSARFAARASGITSSAIRELLKISEQPGFISFAGGFPAPEFFPAQEVAATTRSLLRTDAAKALQYGATEGYRPLRDLWAEKMQARGVRVTWENVLVTSGSQQALDLLGKVLLDAGDEVLVEAPTYLAALQAWSVYGAQFRSVATDAHGLIPGLLPQNTGNVKFLYTIPTFQNPGGSTLSLQRRQELIRYSRTHGLPIVEDDPYGELRYEGAELPRLAELEQGEGRVIYLSTYSKTLAPSLRVGVLIGSIPLIRKLVQAKQATDLHTSVLNQMVAYELDRSGFVHNQIERLKNVYRERRDAMVNALRTYFPADTRFTVPEGGMFLWLQLPDGIDAVQLLQRAVESNVAFVPGRYFFPDGSGADTVRLNFSNSPPQLIEEGVRRLARLLYIDNLEATA